MDVTEYDKHTKRKTIARGGKSKKTGLNLTPQQQKAVINEIGGDVDVNEIKSKVNDQNNGKFGASVSAKIMTKNEKHLVEMLSTVSVISTEMDILGEKANERKEDSTRMLLKQQQLENQMFVLNQNMAKILEIIDKEGTKPTKSKTGGFNM